jgi:ketosteroid isomerase-like protein
VIAGDRGKSLRVRLYRSGRPRELAAGAAVSFALAEGQYREGMHRRALTPADRPAGGAMSATVRGGPRALGEPADPRQRRLLGRYAAAFENADGIALTRLLRADAVLEMPPSPTWFAGRDPIAAFLAARVLGRPGDFTMVRVAANGQPGFAAYRRDHDGRYRAHAVQVLTVDATSIARIVSFNQPELFPMFGLPPVLPR